MKKPPGQLSASALGRLTGQDSRHEVRTALRKTKALPETGEAMKPDTPPTVRQTAGGEVIGLPSRRSGGEGVL